MSHHQGGMFFRFSFLYVLLITAMQSTAAERITLRADNWDSLVPQGKEVDCIYGDVVLQNDVLVAIIGRPVATRNANMTVRNVGGAVIDLTRKSAPNDQLSAFFPGGGQFVFSAVDQEIDTAESASEVSFRCRSGDATEQPTLDVIYRLTDGEPWLYVETVYTNPHAQAVTFELRDAVRADRSFQFSFDAAAQLFMAEDDWWHQSYALVGEGRQPVPIADSVEKHGRFWHGSKTARPRFIWSRARPTPWCDGCCQRPTVCKCRDWSDNYKVNNSVPWN
jgi:hypothetical protein